MQPGAGWSVSCLCGFRRRAESCPFRKKVVAPRPRERRPTRPSATPLSEEPQCIHIVAHGLAQQEHADAADQPGGVPAEMCRVGGGPAAAGEADQVQRDPEQHDPRGGDGPEADQDEDHQHADMHARQQHGKGAHQSAHAAAGPDDRRRSSSAGGLRRPACRRRDTAATGPQWPIRSSSGRPNTHRPSMLKPRCSRRYRPLPPLSPPVKGLSWVNW